MYSIDQNILPPPYSLLISIFLILSLHLVGNLVLSKFKIIKNKKNENWITFQSVPFGGLLIGTLIHAIVLLDLSSRFLLKGFGIFLVLVGIIQFHQVIQWANTKTNEIIFYLKKIKEADIAFKISLLILIGLGLLSLGPITHADAIDYHYGRALKILNNGGLDIEFGWYTGRLSGLGESLNALSLSVGAEQFTGLLQYLSLTSITAIIYTFFSGRKINSNNLNFYIQNNALNLILLATVSTPVLIMLLSSSKHQMWPIALTTFAIALTMRLLERKGLIKDSIILYSIILILLLTAFQIKFSYCISAFTIGLIATISMARKKLFFLSILILIALILLLIGPTFYFKLVTFNSTFLNTLISPIPGHGIDIDSFTKSIQHAPDYVSNFIFPISVLIPNSFGSYGVILGIGWLLLMNLKIDKTYISWVILASFFIVILNVNLAPRGARLYLEPYFWLLLLLTKNTEKNRFKVNRYISLLILGQGCVTLICILYGVVTISPGAFSEDLRKEILTKNSDDYEVMKWADKVLPGDAVLLNTSRSAALVPRESVNGGIYSFLNYSDPKDSSSNIYLQNLIDKKVNYVLVIYPENLSKSLEKCYGQIFAGPFKYSSASRNPFNKKNSKEAWILEFQSEKLPKCAK